MHSGEDNPVILRNKTVKEAIFTMTEKGLGATSIVDAEGILVGIVTDGDIRRSIEKGHQFLDEAVEKIMTPDPKTITKEKLNRIDRAEQFLLDRGLTQLRVRCHDDVARIEVPAEDRARFLDDAFAKEVYAAFQSFGFSYVSLDLLGYRMGSMNETLR